MRKEGRKWWDWDITPARDTTTKDPRLVVLIRSQAMAWFESANRKDGVLLQHKARIDDKLCGGSCEGPQLVPSHHHGGRGLIV